MADVLASGHTLAGRYHLESKVAVGGVGQVWRASDTVLGRTVAVKVLLRDKPGAASLEDRFLDEARTAAALDDPGVVGVYDYGEDGGIAYLVMAYVQGEPLRSLIASRGRLTPAETMAIVGRVARALSAVHRAGIVHRDVKPGNLIRQEDGSIVLVDFGIAHLPEPTHHTAAGEVIGTPLYIAPEQVSKQPITPATDLYALGAVAYHCLAGEPPFPGDNAITVALQHLHDEPPPLPDDVPPAVAAIVARAMAKDPDDRFPSAVAMAEAADAWTDHDPQPLEPTVAVPRPQPSAGWHRWGLAALSLGCLALLIVIALGVGSGTTPIPPASPSDPRPGPTAPNQPGGPAGNGGAGGPSAGPSADQPVTPTPAGTGTSEATPEPTTVPTQPPVTDPPEPEPTDVPAGASEPPVTPAGPGSSNVDGSER
jgi:serine/threonine protein kinase